MNPDGIAIGAALVLGLVASGHCLVMCGGITAALGVVTARRPDGRPRRDLLVGYQLGRITSYALAGLLFSGALGGAIALLDENGIRIALRVASAAALVVAALVAFGGLRDPGRVVGRRIWTRLAPLGRRLLPIATLPRSIAFGMIWGWMPCGFVYTVLLLATLAASPLRGAATMAAFGVGTAPALLAAAFGSNWIARAGARRGARRAAGALLIASAALMLIGPWFAASHAQWLHAWLPFGCEAHSR